MALNPPISLSGVPLRLDGEYLMLERKHIECEFKVPVFGKKTGKGKVYFPYYHNNLFSYISQQQEWFLSTMIMQKVISNHLTFLFYH